MNRNNEKSISYEHSIQILQRLFGNSLVYSGTEQDYHKLFIIFKTNIFSYA